MSIQRLPKRVIEPPQRCPQGVGTTLRDRGPRQVEFLRLRGSVDGPCRLTACLYENGVL